MLNKAKNTKNQVSQAKISAKGNILNTRQRSKEKCMEDLVDRLAQNVEEED